MAGRNLSTFGIARMLRADPGSVANWIDQGLLKAHRTPGGHRRVLAEDLIQFLREHKMPIPPELGTVPTRVLVVDEEPMVTQLIARAIESSHDDYEVVQAHDAFRAGTVLATQKPDVVLLDLRIPGVDACDVCRMIKSQDHTQHAGVIAMTAYPSPESESRILGCGAQACLTKPLDMARVLKEIEAAVEGAAAGHEGR